MVLVYNRDNFIRKCRLAPAPPNGKLNEFIASTFHTLINLWTQRKRTQRRKDSNQRRLRVHLLVHLPYLSRP